MIKGVIKGTFIFGAGLGIGFGVGYGKALHDLDREDVQDLVKLGKEGFADARNWIRIDIEERRKQTAIFQETADAIHSQRTTERQEAEQLQREHVDEPETPEVDEPEEETPS